MEKKQEFSPISPKIKQASVDGPLSPHVLPEKLPVDHRELQIEELQDPGLKGVQ